MGTEGDAFFFAFSRAGDAVAAALEGQRAIESHAWPEDTPIRVRIGLHTGEALVRDGDYVGHDVHKAKRICDAGHGGQIVLSQVTAELVASSVSTKDLGPHRLKDLAEPERLLQVVSEDLRVDFPPLRSLAAFVHNLPVQRTDLIGRAREIVEIHGLLADHRLVTLTGIGGCGKTRLAIHVGADRLDRHRDGVFFVDLAPVSDPRFVASTLATTIGVPSDGQLTDFLARRECLLILDNCEHVLDEVAEAVDQILGGCPGVVLLATSREALGVEGERTWQVPSLSLPDEAVELFEARAKAARREFELSPANRDVIGEICKRLDGIPLAIELAAARVSHLPPREIAARLDDMFRLLTGGRRRVQRQQTLEATLDWSYELLRDPDQILLRRLAVFSGSFTIDSAERICAMDGVDEGVTLDLIASLVAKSLIVPADAEGSARYRLLEPVRIYAAEKLRGAGEADTFRTRHRDSYLAWLESFSWEQIYLSNSVALELEDEHANIRAALDWSEAEGRLDLVARMGARLWLLWADGGVIEEGGRYLGDIEPEELEISRELRVAVLALISSIHPDKRRAFLDRAIAAGTGQASAPLCWALFRRAMEHAFRSSWGSDEGAAAAARSDLEHIDVIAHDIPGADAWRDYIPMERGVVDLILGDFLPAAEALWAGTETADVYPGWLLNVAAATHASGQHERARIAAERWLERSRPWVQRSRFFRGWHATPAIALAGAGEMQRARELLLLALEEYMRVPDRRGFPELILGWVAIAYLSGDLASAVRLLAWIRSQTLAERKALGSTMAVAFYRYYGDRLEVVLDRDDLSRYWAEGSAMSEADVIALARAM